MDCRGSKQAFRVVAEDGQIVCERCEVADTAPKRMRGLLGRSGLEAGGGMLLPREPSVHTFFMRFPIDVVFLDKAKTIVKVVNELRPWRVAAAWKAVAVLELPAGTAASVGLRAGMTLISSPVGEVGSDVAAA
jgi:uncharacterized protein